MRFVVGIAHTSGIPVGQVELALFRSGYQTYEYDVVDIAAHLHNASTNVAWRAQQIANHLYRQWHPHFQPALYVGVVGGFIGTVWGAVAAIRSAKDTECGTCALNPNTLHAHISTKLGKRVPQPPYQVTPMKEIIDTLAAVIKKELLQQSS